MYRLWVTFYEPDAETVSQLTPEKDVAYALFRLARKFIERQDSIAVAILESEGPIGSWQFVRSFNYAGKDN